MRKLSRLFPIRRSKPVPPGGGQGLVEFALVLPVLLLIMLGVIELGHLLFYYSSVYAATREAARYGAAVDVPGATPKYEDVAGMREAAKRVGFIVGLADDQIDISYDCGNGTTSSLTVPTCNTNQMLRVAVQVDATYNTIVPFPPVPSFPISSTVIRTVVHNLEVEGNFPPVPLPPDPPVPDCADLGELVAYRYDPVNYPLWHVVTIHAGDEPMTMTYFFVDSNPPQPKKLLKILLDPEFVSGNLDPDQVVDVAKGLLWEGSKNEYTFRLDGRQVAAADCVFFVKFEQADYAADINLGTQCGMKSVHIP